MAEYIKTGFKQELKICPICKLEKPMRFNQKVCPGDCAIKNNKLLQKICRERQKKKVVSEVVVKDPTKWRELTDLTEGLICIYIYASGERNTIKQIAENLSRPVEQVKSILSEAHKSGRYDKYIEQLKKYHNTYYELQRGAI